ncbi:MAG: hypothetical protein ACRC6U_00790 [Fusobacteriaceae bacterium]
MALFSKLKLVGETLGKTAGGLANTISNNMSEANATLIEKNKIAKLESEKNGLQNEINLAYAQIGKRFVEVALETNQIPDIGVNNILEMLDPKLTRTQEIEDEIIQLEKKLKDQTIIQEKAKYSQEFEVEKQKLQKALNMGIITQNEYLEKVNTISIKLNNFEEIRRIEQQYEMGIISLEEKEKKIKELI